MAGYLGLTDSKEHMRLLTDSEIFTFVDAYLREERRSFNHIQYMANGLPGKGTQDKVTDLRLPSRYIQSAPLSKVPQEGTLISVKDICDAVLSPPPAKSKKRVATKQHRRFYAKVDYQRLGLDPNFPQHEFNSRPYKSS